MDDETCVPKSAIAVDGVLKEVDYQVRKLDECVGKMASEIDRKSTRLNSSH